MGNIFVATAGLWILELLFVTPLAAFLSRRSTARPAVAGTGSVVAPAPIDTASYVLASVLVLGSAGLLLGLAGYWFVGFSMKAKGWPGILAFIGLSLLGCQLAKGF